ncbi:MAG: NAD(P)-binding protein [Lachnospiraceae bacterium]|nr:NAD(P)-binding protein [Lachnospiraceae bacterium]
MIRISDVKVKVNISEDDFKKKVAGILHVEPKDITSITIDKRSIDARKKPDVYYVLRLIVEATNEKKILGDKRIIKDGNIEAYVEMRYEFLRDVKSERTVISNRPVIIGAGPCGLFAAYFLAKYGYKPIILERGKCVEDRTEDVNKFFATGVLDTESNVQFGEGGAGAFSDGKLNTLVKDPLLRSDEVLRIFTECGADPDIRYEAKPHVGTDVLFTVIKNLRKKIEDYGGEFRFKTKVTGFNISNNNLTGVITDKGENINTDICILAIGHSARDTFKVLYDLKVSMEPKAFAVGFRVEHPQKMIDYSQYKEASEYLPAAPYKLTHTAESGRGVYTFCMCPGGYVVNASSEDGKLAVNGMSYKKRDGINANSAVIVSVTPNDYPGEGPLAGVEFQRSIEKKAYELGHGNIPQQRFIDFVENTESKSLGHISSAIKGKSTLTNLRQIYSEEINLSFIEGIRAFGHKIKGFDDDDMVMSGVESRTSSPLRIIRNDDYVSNIEGLYPAGEGAGYAGGIMSAAMDGMKVAEKIATLYKP